MFLPNLRSLVLNVLVPPKAVVTPPGPSGPTANTFMFVWGRQATVNGVHGLSDVTNRDQISQMENTFWSVLANGSHLASTSINMGGIKSGGSLWTWGHGGNGQRGNNSVVTVSSPVQVGADTDWLKLSLGTYTGAAIKTNGTLWSWGRNTSGQLGIGNITTTSSPIQVGSDANWSDILVGEYHCLGLKSDGTIWTWGANAVGQLGLSDIASRSVPVQIGTGTGWSKIGIGARGGAAIDTTNRLWVWGLNSTGMLGVGDSVNRSSPVQVGALTDWSSISLGSNGYGSRFSTAVKTNGTLWTWGSNSYGQLGSGTTTSRSSPVQVGSDNTWTKSLVSRYGMLAIKSGELWVTGRNHYGTIGEKISFRGSNISPIQVGTSTSWSTGSGKIAAAYSNFAITNSGGLWSWSNNTSGQLGLGNTTSRSSPVQVGSDLTWATVSHNYAGGRRAVLATKTNGTLWSWGSNDAGVLGLGNTVNRSSPVQIGSDTSWGITFGNFSSGNFFSLALKSGQLWSWGSNANGQLGSGTIVDRSSPVQVGSDTNWSFVSCFRYHSMALKTDGSLWGWGLNSSGALGDRTIVAKSSPIQIGSSTDWSSLTTGMQSTMAIKTTGTLWSWGRNSFGQLGLGNISDRSSPVQIGTDTNWSKVYAGDYTTFAIKTNGTLWAWGRNLHGNLGILNGLDRSSPVQVGTDTNWVAVRPGTNHTIAVKSDGSLWAWGRHFGGRCGFAGTTNYLITTSSPVQIGSLNTWVDACTRNTEVIWALKA